MITTELVRAMHSRSVTASSADRRFRANSMPSIGGRDGADPAVTTTASALIVCPSERVTEPSAISTTEPTTTRSMKEWGYGAGYEHAHNYEDALTGMECLPPSLASSHGGEPSDEVMPPGSVHHVDGHSGSAHCGSGVEPGVPSADDHHSLDLGSFNHAVRHVDASSHDGDRASTPGSE